MDYIYKDGELCHYGVLGMKWGQRRAQNRLARIERKAAKKGWSDDTTAVAKIKTKKLNQMSNSELKKFNERVRLENEYKNLTKKQVGPGRKFVNEIARETAKDTVKSYTTKFAKQGIDWFINRAKEPI